jgi:uncharacterized protein YebE (UPF0316 family)
MTLPMATSFSCFPLLPVVVFLAELCVVTLSTLRIIFIARGKKVLAPAVGFFEITIWLFAISQVMQNLDDSGCFLGFAGGFTLGNYLGMLIERWLALGTVVVRTITHKDATELIQSLQLARYGVTSLDAEGARGPVKVVLSVVPRKELDDVLGIVRRFDPAAFYSVDDIQDAAPGVCRERRRWRGVLPSVFEPSRRAA